eukprot:2278358-Lingulodinium_polyedra.AAC.1
MLTTRRAEWLTLNFCSFMHVAPNALSAWGVRMDRATVTRTRRELMRAPCSPPASAWRRLRSAARHIALWTCGLPRLART